MPEGDLRAQIQKMRDQRLADFSFTVDGKGRVSVHGLRTHPITLYAEEWTALFKLADRVNAFIEANERPGLANHEPQPTAAAFLDYLFPGQPGQPLVWTPEEPPPHRD